jgi:hypothetical protein
MRDLDVVLNVFPPDASGYQADGRRLAVVVLQVVEYWPSPAATVAGTRGHVHACTPG